MSTFTADLTFGPYQAGYELDGSWNQRTLRYNTLSDAIYRASVLQPAVAVFNNRASVSVIIPIFGDSITERFNSYTYGLGWQDLFAQALRTAFPTTGATGQSGSAYVPSFYSHSPNAWTGTQSYIVGSDTGTVNEGASGLFSGHVVTLGSVGASRSYNWSGTSFRFPYAGWTGVYGSFRLQVDGGTTPGTDQFDITSTGADSIELFTSPTFAAGAHTLKVTALTVGGSTLSVAYPGVIFHNGDETKGILTLDGAHQTWRPQDFLTSGQNAMAALNVLTSFGDVPFIIIALTTNPYIFQDALATFTTNLTSMASQARAEVGDTNCPILFVSFTQPGDVATRAIPFVGTAGTPGYITTVDAFCDSDGKSAHLKMGNNGLVTPPVLPTVDPTGVWSGDGIHPTTFGQATMGTIASTTIVAALQSLGVS